MRIVIDMQGAQSASRQRGIGRLTISLVKAIVANRGEHEVILALNGFFPDTIETIRSTFNKMLPQENIRVWQAIGPVSCLISENRWRRKVSEWVREAFLSSLKPDIVLVSSLFEGLGDDAVTSIGTFSNDIPTAVILYDLIPLIYRDLYLKKPEFEAWYEQKLDHLRRANLLLSISESSRQEAIQYLGFLPDSVVNISAAVDSDFMSKTIAPSINESIRYRYGVSHPFVMYTGAAVEPRKNIEGLMRAYAQLPRSLREMHQLVVVCSIHAEERSRLNSLARKLGMGAEELVLTGYVPDEDLVTLYNMCKAFVFPSWHEGFGLPVLEAMSCGAAVIGANSSSIPEIIDFDDALFDPRDDDSMAKKLSQVLTDIDFRAVLQKHGIKQAYKFNWDTSAKRAIAAIEQWFEGRFLNNVPLRLPVRRPKMAYVSPLPPERSGISDYSAELLPELARYYEIDVIVDQERISSTWVNANCPIRDAEWLHQHAKEYDRVLYHFGNSHFHNYMISLLEEVPGVVVLHDFFMSGLLTNVNKNKPIQNLWEKELYYSHGYKALQERFHSSEVDQIILKYPCNLSVLHRAQGVIIHSDYSRRLAKQWYPLLNTDNWVTIPLLRTSRTNIDRLAARQALDMEKGAFVVCSFGLLGPTKLNHRLLKAWLHSRLAHDKNSVLIFVGENHGGDYGKELLKMIRESGIDTRIHITGWVDSTTFHNYLAAADIGVQLRSLSRGETSAAVLDCMNYGIPTIVNANGSMEDLQDDVVWKLPDEFTDEQLVDALETLWNDSKKQSMLGELSQEYINKHYGPKYSSREYFNAIENDYSKLEFGVQNLIDKIAFLDEHKPNDSECMKLANNIAQNETVCISKRQLLVDISELVVRDAKSGIQRVTRSILNELLNLNSQEFRVEPIYANTSETGYRYARRFTLDFLGCPSDIVADEPIEFQNSDVFLGLDFQSHVVIAQEKFLTNMHHLGVRIYFVVYDLLPVLMPNVFPSGSDSIHEAWLKTISKFDGSICISEKVADDLHKWIHKYGSQRPRPFKVSWSHIGADVENSIPSKGIPADADRMLVAISSCISFLMVGTIEPRKGHAQTLAAFEKLWSDGAHLNLVIIGKQGWMVDPLIEKIRNHPERGQKLIWLEGISDEYLEKIYSNSTCLIAASEGEGFGLPLIEAAQHKLPIIARDIPVFHEVAGEHAFYFGGKDANSLASSIQLWIELFHQNKHPKSDNMKWLTWAESAKNMLDIILE